MACQYLEKVGIRTLATCLFNLPQALAANQAGCLYVAPYFNGERLYTFCSLIVRDINHTLSELRVHFEPGLWKEYTDTAAEHPVIPIIRSIVETYHKIGAKTLVMPAR